VLVTDTTSWNSWKVALSDGELSCETVKIGLEVQVLLQGEGESSGGDLALGVVELHADLGNFSWRVAVLLESDFEIVGSFLLAAADSHVCGLLSSDGADWGLDWVSDDKSLFVLEFWLADESWLQKTFDMVGDVSKVSIALLEKGSGKMCWEHEREWEGPLTGSEASPLIDRELVVADFGPFLSVDVDPLDGVVWLLTRLSVDEVDVFLALELHGELIAWIRDVEIEVDVAIDGFSWVIGLLFNLNVDLAVLHGDSVHLAF